jgi:hypothetical protein
MLLNHLRLRAYFNRVRVALILFVLFVGFTIIVDAASQHLRRSYLLAIVAIVLGFWLRYSRKVRTLVFGAGKNVAHAQRNH